MQVEKSGGQTRIVLDPVELRLLRHALERASFIDTPAAEQPAIAAFCARALDVLASPGPE